MIKMSPIFYMGNKYKLLKDLLPIFPSTINTFVDLFGGSGVVSMNVKANRIIYNEFNHNVVNLVKLFKDGDPKELDTYFKETRDKYGLEDFSLPSDERALDGYVIRQPKYNRMRNDYNSSKDKDIRLLYLLICYAINNLIRFNKNDEFNAPSGSGAYSDRVYDRIKTFHKRMKDIEIISGDAFEFDFDSLKIGDFVYIDPPYLNSIAMYNEDRAFGGWNIKDDERLFKLLEDLDSKGVKWGMSNIFFNRGKTNNHLIKWCKDKGWNVVHLDRNYTPFSKGSGDTDEVYINNYLKEQPKKLSLI